MYETYLREISSRNIYEKYLREIPTRNIYRLSDKEVFYFQLGEWFRKPIMQIILSTMLIKINPAYLVSEKLPVFCIPIEYPGIEGSEMTVDEGDMFAVETEPNRRCSFENVRHSTCSIVYG